MRYDGGLRATRDGEELGSGSTSVKPELVGERNADPVVRALFPIWKFREDLVVLGASDQGDLF